MTTATTEQGVLPSDLEHVLVNLGCCGQLVCPYLDARDAMNLSMTNKSIHEWFQNHIVTDAMMQWWKDQHMLTLLGIKRDLLCKVRNAYVAGGWEVIETDERENSAETIVQMIETKTEECFGVGSFGDLTQDDATFHEYPEHVVNQVTVESPKRMKHECVRCGQNDRSGLYFFFNPECSPRCYCSACMDQDVFLRIAYAKRHQVGMEGTYWEVDEDNVMSQTYGRALDDDEFSISFFLCHNYGCSVTYWFIGKGPKDPNVDYTENVHE